MQVSINGLRLALMVAALTAASNPAAAPAPVAVRQNGFKALGAAFKQINDLLRSGNTESPTLASAGHQVQIAARAQYGWFPKGSGPRPGIRTAARPDIWTRPAEFRAAQDAFFRQAATFGQAVGSRDATALRNETRKLGATCKGCHDNFRESDD